MMPDISTFAKEGDAELIKHLAGKAGVSERAIVRTALDFGLLRMTEFSEKMLPIWLKEMRERGGKIN